jgi:hypothetical protein
MRFSHATICMVALLCFIPALAAAQYVAPAPEVEATPPPEGSSLDLSRAPAPQRPAVDAGPFSRGSVNLSISGGTVWDGSRTYLVLGLGLGIYVVNGLELALGGSIWLFDSPFAATVTPSATYTFWFVPTVKPYFGGFYRHYMIGDDRKDLDGIGLRAGLYLMPNTSRLRFGIGAVYEHIVDCNEHDWSCDDIYPEVSFAISF